MPFRLNKFSKLYWVLTTFYILCFMGEYFFLERFFLDLSVENIDWHYGKFQFILVVYYMFCCFFLGRYIFEYMLANKSIFGLSFIREEENKTNERILKSPRLRSYLVATAFMGRFVLYFFVVSMVLDSLSVMFFMQNVELFIQVNLEVWLDFLLALLPWMFLMKIFLIALVNFYVCKKTLSKRIFNMTYLKILDAEC